MDQFKFVFRGRHLKTLGNMADEIYRITFEAPQDAEDFKNAYLVALWRANPEGTLTEAEGTTGSNIRWYARNGEQADYDKIMSTFYPPVEVANG